MVLVAGLRDGSVGTDSVYYLIFFDRITSFDEVVKYGNDTLEYGYWTLNWLVHYLSDQYMALFFAIATIVIGCYLRAIFENSRNVAISLFLFISMGHYTFFFNGARQGIACAICSLAIKPLIDRNIWKYLGCVALAVTFHKTAIIMVPVYFLFGRKNTLMRNLLFWFLGVFCAVAIQPLVAIASSFDERYSKYGDSGDGGGYIIVAFYLLLTLFFLGCKGLITIDRKRYHIFLNMLVFGSVISLVSVFFRLNPSGILRLCLYFNVSAIFLWPILFRNILDQSARYFLVGAFSLFYVAFYILTTSRFSKLTPYSLNESLYLF